jgi:hypothetical protein
MQMEHSPTVEVQSEEDADALVCLGGDYDDVPCEPATQVVIENIAQHVPASVLRDETIPEQFEEVQHAKEEGQGALLDTKERLYVDAHRELRAPTLSVDFSRKDAKGSPWPKHSGIAEAEAARMTQIYDRAEVRESVFATLILGCLERRNAHSPEQT